MGALRRAFLAVIPPPTVLDAVEAVVEGGTRRGFRWTRRDQWHVTIQYFGKVADADALIGALAGPLAKVPPASVQLRGAGGFPSAKRASVYWFGVADPGPLRRVHEAVIEGAVDFIRPRDLGVYTPHLTLARLPAPKRLTEEVEALASVDLGSPWTVDEIVLLESETRREGAVYRTVARLPLE
jgi:2'-5' RNA ligase